MYTENLNLKRALVMQSFAPLFLLLLIKYFDIRPYIRLICCLSKPLFNSRIKATCTVIKHIFTGSFFITLISLVWLIITVVIYFGFKGLQKGGFVSKGERIIIEDSYNDSGASFLVTYVLPLLTGDVESFRNLLSFLFILIMVIILLSKSNTFYQNPILLAMNYRTFSFRFRNPSSDIKYPNGAYIGITYKASINEEDIIKRKYISDGVFIVYNDK